MSADIATAFQRMVEAMQVYELLERGSPIDALDCAAHDADHANIWLVETMNRTSKTIHIDRLTENFERTVIFAALAVADWDLERAAQRFQLHPEALRLRCKRCVPPIELSSTFRDTFRARLAELKAETTP